MRLKSFQVLNYRSIIDSRECYLSPEDGITVLAGQNESGKSSLLEALKHYRDGTPCPDAYREDDESIRRPKVICKYILDESEDLYQFILMNGNLSGNDKDIISTNAIAELLTGVTEFKLERTIGNFSTDKYKAVYTFDGESKLKAFPVRINDRMRGLSPGFVLRWLGEVLLPLTPKIVLFNEFFDILPDKFYLHDLNDKSTARGVQAVRNVEAILETDFKELEELNDSMAIKRTSKFKAKLTTDFNDRWSQRIADETGASIGVTFHQGRRDENPYVRFSIETREGEQLSPEKRSMGFKWFLSFYLHLTAESRINANAVLLFDEPGVHLHSRALYDMLKVFEELSKTNDIIYATHSPYLIDTNNLHRIRLVFNVGKAGTKVDKITSGTSAKKRDSIKPIVDALGMQVAHDFSAAKDRNVIVEGISDHYYLSAAKKMLGITEEFFFMPAMGTSQAHLLMELCIGWGLQWLMIFDEKGSEKDANKIRKQFFSDSAAADAKIYILKGCDGIEEIFDEADLKLAQPSFVRTSAPIVQDLKAHGDKELIGRFFSDKVEAGEITWDKLSKKAQDHFTEIFAFIERGFK